MYKHDYGYGNLQYELTKYTIYDEKNGSDNYLQTLDPNTNKKIYMVAEEVLEKEEREKLIPFCQCKLCQLSYFNLTRYMACPCCYGCLTSNDNHNNQNIINKSRKKYQQK